jgi:hypothetical protein
MNNNTTTTTVKEAHGKRMSVQKQSLFSLSQHLYLFQPLDPLHLLSDLPVPLQPHRPFRLLKERSKTIDWKEFEDPLTLIQRFTPVTLQDSNDSITINPPTTETIKTEPIQASIHATVESHSEIASGPPPILPQPQTLVEPLPSSEPVLVSHTSTVTHEEPLKIKLSFKDPTASEPVIVKRKKKTSSTTDEPLKKIKLNFS